MSIESALKSEIVLIAAVAALIAERVYPVAAPQTTAPPFIVYRRVVSTVNYTQSGESKTQNAVFQLSAVAETYEGVISLADELRKGLSGKRNLGDGTTMMSPILFRGPEDAWNQETGLFVRTQECTITYSKGD